MEGHEGVVEWTGVECQVEAGTGMMEVVYKTSLHLIFEVDLVIGGGEEEGQISHIMTTEVIVTKDLSHIRMTV